jgi:hypothetical protein
VRGATVQLSRGLALALLLAPAIAHADADDPPAAEPAVVTEPVTEPAADPKADVPTTEELAKQIYDLQRENKQQQNQITALKAKSSVIDELRRFITVYIDVGAFAVGGNGAGIRNDVGHFYYPKYANRIAGQWVFMGDPLSTTINSLGEPADTGTSREIKTDTVNSGGRPSVMVNSVGLAVGKEIKDTGFAVNALVELLPRPDHDILDVELAHIDYRPLEESDFIIAVGKVDSVLGIEYRNQDAPRRLGITPSLIARYTTGRPVGAQARLVSGRLSVSAAVTDGDNFDRRFEHEADLKANTLPTASGHLQWMLPVGDGLEVGVSGALGPQDGQSDLGVAQYHLGFDARLRNFHHVNVSAEYVQGVQQGRTISPTPCDAAPCLSYKGGYILVDRKLNRWLTPYVRADWRDAVHQSGVDFVYESHTARATVGAHFEVTSRIIGKIEYTWNHELGAIPQFPDDVLTTSVVVATD